MLKKKIWANFERIIELFTKKSQKWGFGFRDPENPAQHEVLETLTQDSQILECAVLKF